MFFTTENAITGSGNDILSADYLNNQSDNEFTGGPGNDQIEGGAGNDIFHEGSAANGADAMEGDAGADTADYSQRTNPVTVSLDGNSNDGEAGEGDNVGAGLFSNGVTGCLRRGLLRRPILDGDRHDSGHRRSTSTSAAARVESEPGRRRTRRTIWWMPRSRT